MFFLFKFHGMPFFESGGTEVFKAASNKLFACSEKLIDNHTLMLGMRHSYMSFVFTYHWRGVFKKIVWYGHCSLLIFVAKKLLKALNFNLYVHKAPSRWKTKVFLDNNFETPFFFFFSAHVACIRCSDTCVVLVRSLVLRSIETEFTLLLVVIW